MTTHPSKTKIKDIFIEKMNKHIYLVTQYINKLPDMPLEEKNKRILAHDQDKLKEPLLSPFSWIYYDAHCKKNNIPLDVTIFHHDAIKLMKHATFTHRTCQSHHPAYHYPLKHTLESVDLRLQTFSPIDCTSMPEYDIMEMCADWYAVANKLNVATPIKWAKSVTIENYIFTENQKELIFKTIAQLANT